MTPVILPWEALEFWKKELQHTPESSDLSLELKTQVTDSERDGAAVISDVISLSVHPSGTGC